MTPAAPGTRESATFVTLKLAASLDGKIALGNGASQWITGPSARAEVHRLRARHAAVAVGIGTALADDPELTARTDPPPDVQPLRLVFDTHLRLPVVSKLARTAQRWPVHVLGGVGADGDRISALEAMGVAVHLGPVTQGQVDIGWALPHLREAAGVTSIFLEGGAGLAAAFLRAHLVDRIELFRAPFFIGAEGRSCVGPLGVEDLASPRRYRRTGARSVGPDLWETLDRTQTCSPGS